MRKKTKIMRFIWDILIVLFLAGFILALFGYVNGSLEMIPTEEQQEKARTGAVLLMFVTGLSCISCIAVRIKYRKISDLFE